MLDEIDQMIGLSSVKEEVNKLLAGIVGFVGLVAPHGVRLLAGPGHRGVLPGSALLGAAPAGNATIVKVANPIDIFTGQKLIVIGILTILVLYFLMSLAIAGAIGWLERRVTRGLDGVR